MKLRISPTIVIGKLIVLAITAGIVLPITTCSPKVSILEQVRSTGTLRVATVNSPTTYYTGPLGDEGFEYDLAKGFAEALDVKLDLIVLDTVADVLEAVRTGSAQLGAAGLAVTENRRDYLRFTTPLRTIVPQLVYRMGENRPRDIDDLDESSQLVVVKDSAHAEWLERLKRDHPDLAWEETDEFESEDLLVQVVEGRIGYTVANSDLVTINQRYYPQLRVAFALADKQDLAWALPSDAGPLFDAAQAYLNQLGETELGWLHDRYFGHIDRVGYLGAVALATHAESRLPRYRADFEAAAEKYGLDWRLLAAVGYQESVWDPEATSTTGVRGLMQITVQTAEFLGVADRLDPAEAIDGAARYLQSLRDRIPDEVQEPDRSWMMLAAYNMGMGHIIDVRKLTAAQGGDPNRWPDVRSRLPLLMQPKYYRELKYGYARGREAVAYVGNIRTYYDMLVWITGGPQNLQNEPSPPPKPPQEPPDTSKPFDPLGIDTPVL
jgi:membrane-bound lytic murein transglycosylase F